jgi:hypothetical protein
LDNSHKAVTLLHAKVAERWSMLRDRLLRSVFRAVDAGAVGWTVATNFFVAFLPGAFTDFFATRRLPPCHLPNDDHGFAPFRTFVAFAASARLAPTVSWSPL